MMMRFTLERKKDERQKEEDAGYLYYELTDANK